MSVGATFALEFVLKDSEGTVIDLSAYEADIQVRTRLSEAMPTIELTTAEEQTTWGSSLSIDGPAGKISILITPAETDMLLSISEEIRGTWDVRMQRSDGWVDVIYRSSPFVIKPVSTRVAMT